MIRDAPAGNACGALFDVTAVVVSALIIFFVYTALRDEPLPELLFSPQKRAFKALKESEKEKARERTKKAAARSHRKSKLAASQVKLNQAEGIRAGFYVPWDAASFSSLRAFAHQIDMLYPDWLHVLTPDGRLQGVDDQTNKYFDVVQGNNVLPVDDRVMPFLKNENPAMEVFPMVNNSDGTDWVDVSRFPEQCRMREHFPAAGAAVSFVRPLSRADDRLRGVSRRAGSPATSRCCRNCPTICMLAGMKLYVAVPPHNDEFDYPAVAAAADGVVLMNYDEHYPGAASGPVASQDWFEQNLKYAASVIPKEKIICAIANYGYDWVQKPKKGNLPPEVHDSTVSVQDAWLAARDSDEDVNFDDDAMNPHFSYLDERNLRHDIWFVDAVTALNHMRAAQNLGIQTFALWRLGSEDRSLWRVWDVPGDPTRPTNFATFLPAPTSIWKAKARFFASKTNPRMARVISASMPTAR